MKKILLALIVTIIGISSSFAQRNYVEDADDKFNLEQYFEAIPLYKKAYTKVKGNKMERNRILYNTAICYRKINDTKNAESTFKRVIAAKYPEPLAYLYYADALKINEKYEDASIQYAEFKNLVPGDPRGDIGIESCKMAVQWKNNPTRYEVDINKKMNNKANDFAPSYADKKYRTIVFTTSREGVVGKGEDAWTGQSFTDLYMIELDRKGNWGTPLPIDDTGELNSTHNEGVASFNDKFNTIYFTRCDVIRKQRSGCQIYTATKRGKGWGDVQLIPVGGDSIAVGHPAVTNDELTIYFASDLPGGYGGKDIWMMQRPKKNRPFEKPVNLGPVINTPGDEMFPTLREDNIMYFSSNYHPGMGALDIFRTELVDGQWTKPENMMSPVNSSGDDFHMVFNKDEKMLKEAYAKEMGFFSSNRKGGRGGVDIWSFKLPPILFTISGIVYDDSTKRVIPYAVVQIVGSDGNIYIDTTDNKGFYKFNEAQILENTSYLMEVSKKDYFNEKGRETTVGLTKTTDLVKDFYLVPIPKKPIVLPEIRYDLAKWDLKPEYYSSLDGLIATMTENPNLVIELQSHTDVRPIPMTNDTLSQRRAQSVVDYLIGKGIAGDRLVAKGYGERVPRVLEKDITITYNKKDFTFKQGTVLTKEYIESLPTNDEREAAHQLNRRTTFIILRTDYVPKQGGNIEVQKPKVEIIKNEDQKEEEKLQEKPQDNPQQKPQQNPQQNPQQKPKTN